jgi:alpha-beta hydrolase superfamily lysophospholipase
MEPAMHFALNGFDVHLGDLRGYGLSGGVRAGKNTISDFQCDLARHIQEVRTDLPLFLMGHSLGGMTTTSLLMNNPKLELAGVILSAPLLDIHPKVVPWDKKIILKFIHYFISDILLNCNISPE